MELLDKLGIDWRLLIAQIINFVILLAILTRFVFHPMTKFLRERSDRIGKSLEEAKQIEGRMREIASEREQVILLARKQSEQIVTEAKKAAETIHADAIVKGKTTVESMIASAKIEIASERREALDAAKAEIADLVIMVSEKVLGEEVSPSWEKKKVHDLINTIASEAKQS